MMERGTIKIIEDFFMPKLNRNRTIRIYLPPKYEESQDFYPVIYMHDAQNLFHKETSAFGMIWNTAEILDKFYNDGKTKGVIVVGIDNGIELRYMEYSPWYSEEAKKLLPRLKDSTLAGGEGFKYIDFIVETLKPYIDSNFRTLTDRDSTSICGSSMGGFISLAAGLKYEDIFSKIAAFSSAIFFAEKEMLDFIKATGKKKDMKIYMDIGTKESSNSENKDFPEIYLNTNKNTYEAIISSGFTKDEVKFVIDEGAVHSEIEWAKRFPGMLQWVYDI
jgi:predicted alpha/beta superfamily hydrolase